MLFVMWCKSVLHVLGRLLKCTELDAAVYVIASLIVWLAASSYRSAQMYPYELHRIVRNAISSSRMMKSSAIQQLIHSLPYTNFV